MAAFGGFTFQTDESPLAAVDTGWVRMPKIDRSTNLGAGRDSIVTLGVGSALRGFELYMTSARYATLAALQNTVANFTDWDAVPDVRSAFLARVEPVQWATPWAGTAAHQVRVRVELIEQ